MSLSFRCQSGHNKITFGCPDCLRAVKLQTPEDVNKTKNRISYLKAQLDSLENNPDYRIEANMLVSEDHGPFKELAGTSDEYKRIKREIMNLKDEITELEKSISNSQ